MTPIHSVRTRVADVSRPAAPPPQTTVVTIDTGKRQQGASLAPSWRTLEGPVANMKVAVIVEGNPRGAMITYKKQTNERGEFPVSIVAGKAPASMLISVNAEGQPPRLYRINIK